jgi:GT2 family glycosyltransferase
MVQFTKKEKVAIILLNWNAYKDTTDCLKSLEELNYPYFHIYLVDNDSQDDSFIKLKEDYLNEQYNIPITFIQSGGNIGFAAGNNVGIKIAKEEGYNYIWMLNNDTIVHQNALIELMNELINNSQTGIVGSKIYYYGTNKIWFAGGLINTWTGRTKHIGIRKEDDGQFNKILEVDYITGCSLLFPTILLDKVGFMIEDYFLYYEETDWNIRVKSAGYKIKYIPTSVVYHKVSISSGGENNLSPYMEYYDLRNGFVMIKRTQTLFKFYSAFLFVCIKIAKKLLRIFAKSQSNKKQRLMYIYKGLIDGLLSKMGKHPEF